MRINLSLKMGSVIGAFALLILINSSALIISESQISRRIEQKRASTVLIQQTSELKENLLQMQVYILDLVANLSNKLPPAVMNEKIKQTNDLMTQIEPLYTQSLTDLTAANLAPKMTEEDFKKFKTSVKDAIDSIAEQDLFMASSYAANARVPYDRIKDSITATSTELQRIDDENTQKLDSILALSRNLTFALAFIGFAIAAAAGYGARQLIVRPVVGLSQVLNTMARGNLDTSPPATRYDDEIRDMSTAVEVLRKNSLEARRLEEEKNLNAQRLLNASEEFQSTVYAIMQDSVMDGVVTATNEVTASIEQISGRTNYVNKAMVTNAERIGTLENNLGVLENAVTNFKAVTSMIQDISERTNLLALNASIEAARAGEHGRGFAIVADEVRKLATQTNEQISAVDGLIGDMAKTSQDLAGALKSMTDAFAETRESTSEISRTIEEQGKAMDDINSLVVRQGQNNSSLQACVQSFLNAISN